MKKNSKKKLIALLCVFALGSANVENSQAMFGGLFGGSISDGIIHGPKNIDKYKKMWVDGIKEIYNNFYNSIEGDRDRYEIIDTDAFANCRYVFHDPNNIPNFNIYSNKNEIFNNQAHWGAPNRLLYSPFANFLRANVARHSNSQINDGINSSFFQNFGFFCSPLTFSNLQTVISSLSFNESITFYNYSAIFNKDNFIPTIPLMPVEQVKKLKIGDKYFKPFGLPLLLCFNNDAISGNLQARFADFSGTCAGFLVAIYSGSKDDFESLTIKMMCSQEINKLKEKIIVVYLEDLLKLNPNVDIKHLCENSGINFIGKIYIKKSKLENLKKLSASGLLKSYFSGSANKDESKEGFFPASEVAYQVWVESRGFPERILRKSVQNCNNAVDVLLPPALALGAWKSSNYFYSYLGDKILRSGEYTSEFLKSRNKLLNDPKKLKEAVSKMMNEGVVGLTDKSEALTNIAMGTIAITKIAILNATHCKLITFLGPPGTGKTLLANKFAVALTGKPLPSWGYFTSSSVRPGIPVVDQFFDGNSELVKRLKACKGETVLFFDEIDKYDSRELLEKFRDAVDGGTMEVTSSETVVERDGFGREKTYKRVKVEKLDVHKLIVIFGTNEKPECWGLPPDDPNDPAENIGRTVVKRDGSMVQRFLRFKFHPFKKSEYKEMYENAFKSIMKDSKRIFGFEIVCEDDLLDKLAEESCYRMQGGRSVAVILNEMAGAITSFDLKKDAEKYETGILAKVKRLVKKRKPKVQKVKVKFNNDTHKFEIEQIVDNADQLPPIKEIPEENEEDNENEKNQEIDNQGINNEVNSDIPDQHDDQKKDNQEVNNQELNNQVINSEIDNNVLNKQEEQKEINNQEIDNQVVDNEVDDNVLNKQDNQQEANSEPIEHQKDESENQKIENDQEFDNKSIISDSASDQHESDQEGIDSYDSDYENDKKPINLEDDREEIIAD